MRKSAQAGASAGATGGAPGRSRVAIFTQALELLVESLDAMIRVDSWHEPEPVPEPVKTSAGQVVARLVVANRLAAGRFSGSIADAARVRTIADAVRNLDAAYVLYVRNSDRTRGAGALSAAILKSKAA